MNTTNKIPGAQELALKLLFPPIPSHPPKVNGATPAFPRCCSLRKRLLILQDFPTPAQAPPSREPSCCPSAKRPPEQRLGGGGEWARPPPLVVRTGGAEGGRAVRPAQRPQAHSGCARCPPLRPAFPRTAPRARIAETRTPSRSSARSPSHPSSRAQSGRSARPDSQKLMLTEMPANLELQNFTQTTGIRSWLLQARSVHSTLLDT
ncbi:uncharacterized protein [Equus przewalskii]|uniref:Uncharacterized protein n=1 Tax=Equus przewalskii TaxID=9798 RepID=A0ABM4L545_EQUPR